MTKEKTIKALNCCFVEHNCNKCPYNRNGCMDAMGRDALTHLEAIPKTVTDISEKLSTVIAKLDEIMEE